VTGWATRKNPISSPPNQSHVNQETVMLKRLTALSVGSSLRQARRSRRRPPSSSRWAGRPRARDAAFFYARDKGYFKAEGLNVVIDQGEGSGATVTRIMGGAYDAGFGDVNAIIQNAAPSPAEAPVMVYMMWNRPPFAISSKKATGITKPKDLKARRWAARRARRRHACWRSSPARTGST
jgi:NitT/TauT family transport system substrate-binding protein